MVSSHAFAASAGVGVGGALVSILAQTWHIDPGFAGDWVIVITGLFAAPVAAVTAYATVKAQTDPALAAALSALSVAINNAPAVAPVAEPEKPVVAAAVISTAPAIRPIA